MLIRSICCLVLTILSAGCARDQANRVEGDTRAPETTGTARLGSAPTDEDGQWIMPAKNHASTRFSGLDQVNTSNVGQLKLAWTFSTDVLRGHEAAPIVVNKRCTS